MAKRPHPTLSELERAAPSLRALLRHLVTDEATVDDVLQETRLTALRSPPASEHNLGAWLRVVARNLALQGHRRETARRRREARAARDEALPSTGSAAARLEAHRRILECVQKLGEPHRTLIVGRYFDGASAVQLAEQHGMSRATVDRRLEAARARLREMLAPEGNPDARRWPIALLVLGQEAGPVKTADLAGTSGLATMGDLTVTAKTALLLPIAVAGLLAVLFLTGEGSRTAPEEDDVPLAQGTAQEPPQLLGTEQPESRATTAAAVRENPGPHDETMVTGFVTGPGGQPVSGARLWIARGTTWPDADSGLALSDRAGRFQVSLPYSQECSVESRESLPSSLMVSADGYLPAEVALRSLLSHRDVRVQLESGFEVRGQVTTPQGWPIPGALVEARGIGAEDAYPVLAARVWARGHAPAYARGTSDADGRFVLRGLTPGQVRVAAQKDGYVTVERPVTAVDAERAVDNVSVELHRLAVLDLRVLSARDGTPVTTACVKLRGTRAKHAPYQPPDPGLLSDVAEPTVLAGRYRARVLMPEGSPDELRVECEVIAPGYEPVRTTLTYEEWPGEVTIIRLMPVSQMVSTKLIFVLGEKTVPLSGILNLHMRIGSERSECVIPVRVRDGAVVAPLPLPQGELSVSVHGAIGQTALWGDAGSLSTYRLDASSATLRLPLQGSKVQFHVRSSTGESLQELEFIINGAQICGTMKTWQDPLMRRRAAAPPALWLSPGKYRMGVRKPGYGMAVRDVEIPDGGSTIKLDFTLKPER